MTFSFEQTPHRRFNPLLREWVLVSPQRTQRPWQGKVEEVAPRDLPSYDPACYLCSGNTRAGAVRNPANTTTFVFDNDYPALLPDSPLGQLDEHGLFRAQTERGICRVVCFSPRHDLTIPRMNDQEIRNSVAAIAEQYAALEKLPWIRYVQFFENRGALVGASNPHPHCQIWATESIPNILARELAAFTDYHREHGCCLLCDYLKLELTRAERVVCANESFVVVVPYWAMWPFETLLLARRHVGAFTDLSEREGVLLGDILRQITIRYDNLFEVPFPYSMGFHPRPANSGPASEWHLHAHYFPPLLRSATVQKFMVGFELLAMPQRDVTPERAAAVLRDLSPVHYADRRATKT
jgi:UDPglucose--hexose-1-phosphate uridylyltransferase